MISKKCIVAMTLVALAASPAMAKPWADLMFKTRSHDFGTVARGANVQFSFVFENPYLEDVQILSVESTCGCTSPRATKRVVKTYETGEIIAELDTRRFTGFKQATVKVKVAFATAPDSQSTPAEVQLQVRAFIRSDVVFEPGSVQFGAVGQGQSVNKGVAVAYAGRSDWQIVGLMSSAPFIDAKIQETGRNPSTTLGASQVSYQLYVTLKGDAPPGPFKEQLILKTNDSSALTSQVPLTVEGLVVTPLAAYPSVLMLGRVQPKEIVSRNLVLRGSTPFKIVEVLAPDERFQFVAKKQSDTVWIVSVQFTADQTPGKVAGKLVIKTDLGTTQVAVNGDVAGSSNEKAASPVLMKEPTESPSSKKADRPSGVLIPATPGKTDARPMPLDPPDLPAPKSERSLKGPVLAPSK